MTINSYLRCTILGSRMQRWTKSTWSLKPWKGKERRKKFASSSCHFAWLVKKTTTHISFREGFSVWCKGMEKGLFWCWSGTGFFLKPHSQWPVKVQQQWQKERKNQCAVSIQFTKVCSFYNSWGRGTDVRQDKHDDTWGIKYEIPLVRSRAKSNKVQVTVEFTNLLLRSFNL